MIDYLDEDVAYLLGMLVARGTISEHRGHYTISIEIPYSYIQIDDPPYNPNGDRNALLVSIDVIINRMTELTMNTPTKRPGENSVSIIFEIPRRTIFIRDLQMLLENKKDYTEFLIPKEIFNTTIDIKKEFIRGFVDVNGKVRKSNAYFNREHRIYIDILNKNWKLPIQLCDLLQNHLNIPVQTITWGHPNLRNKPNEKWAKREHQIKIFNNCFKEIGFYIEHKNKKFLEFAKENEKKGVVCKKCDPLIKMQRKIQKNPPHIDENNVELPKEIRGKHYDTYWQICRDLGCKKFNNINLNHFVKN
ncbi:MAG: hypothetical protein ACTSVV_15960 [Promethearchaeota archaeon]